MLFSRAEVRSSATYELALPLMRTICRPNLSKSNIIVRRGSMSISRLTAALVLSLTIAATIPAGLYAQSAPADQAKTPQLQHFDPDSADKALDPCNDFYKHDCSK